MKQLIYTFVRRSIRAKEQNRTPSTMSENQIGEILRHYAKSDPALDKVCRGFKTPGGSATTMLAAFLEKYSPMYRHDMSVVRIRAIEKELQKRRDTSDVQKEDRVR